MFTPADIAKLAAAVAATILLTLLWIHRSAQTKVDRSTVHSVKVALRLLAIHAVVFYGVCIMGRMSANFYVGLTAFVYFIVATGSYAPPGDDPVSFASASLIFLPCILLSQFVLGFPDVDELILKPPSARPPGDPIPPAPPPPRKSDTGKVVAALRPMGRIELAGEEFNAVSAYGRLIDIGTPIRVTGHRGDAFLVTEQRTDVPAEN